MSRLQSKAVGEPAANFWTLAHLKLQCEVSHDDDDAYLGALAEAAADQLTGTHTVWRRSWISQDWQDFLPEFPADGIKLSLAPAVSVSAVAYLHQDGTERTIDPADYYLIETMTGAEVHLQPGAEWPSDVSTRKDAVRVTYEAGYGDKPADVPRRVVQAHAQLVATWYALRESVVATGTPRKVPQTLEWLMRPYERIALGAG